MKTDENIDIEEYTLIFKALAHPTRLTIAYNLMKKAECNVNRMSECLGMRMFGYSSTNGLSALINIEKCKSPRKPS